MQPSIPNEPSATAWGLLVIGLLFAAAVLLSRVIGRRGVPVVLLFLILGILAGSEGVLGIEFENYALAFRIGTMALVLILFDGGLNTSVGIVRQVLLPATILASAGVVLTAALVGLAGRLVGLGWTEAFLLGAVVSSTDAATVFSVLRGSGVQLKQRVAATLELESGVNDPMAFILTIALTESMITGEPVSFGMLGLGLVQLAVGAALGILFGFAARWILRVPLLAGGLYPVITLAISLLAFATPTLLSGSGFLAVYVAGLVLGNGPLPFRTGILRAHDFLAWFAQILMFLTLGLLVFPSELLGVIGPGLAIAAALGLFARPLATWLCLLPFRYDRAEVLYAGWVGLRGAVPIILASYPMMANIEPAGRIFNIVFFVVVASALVQGWSVPGVTRWLGLQTTAPPPPPASVELSTSIPLEEEILTFYIDDDSPAHSKKLSALDFPSGAAAILVVRGRELVPPRGDTDIRVGDYVYVFAHPQDREQMERIFQASPVETNISDDPTAGM